MTPATPILDTAFVAAFRSGTLTPDLAEAVLPRDRAAAIFFLLQLSTDLGSPAPASGAHQPSGSILPYAKPSAPPRRKKRGVLAVCCRNSGECKMRQLAMADLSVASEGYRADNRSRVGAGVSGLLPGLGSSPETIESSQNLEFYSNARA